jgi:A/G-specific adenine glycosylase
MEKQADGKRHEGMYRLPRRPAEFCTSLPHLTDQKYSITRYKVTRHLYQAPADTPPLPSEEFIPLSRLSATPMASPDRKIIQNHLPH